MACSTRLSPAASVKLCVSIPIMGTGVGAGISVGIAGDSVGCKGGAVTSGAGVDEEAGTMGVGETASVGMTDPTVGAGILHDQAVDANTTHAIISQGTRTRRVRILSTNIKLPLYGLHSR
jgi:hypothetical protein